MEQPTQITTQHTNRSSQLTLTPLFVITLIYLLLSQSIHGQPTNTYCPVTTTEKAEAQFFVNYEGRKIYFCCNKCKKDFLADPEAYLANLVSTDSSNNVQATLVHDEATTTTYPEHLEQSKVQSDNAKSSDLTALATTSADASHQDGEDHDHNTDHGEPSSWLTFAGKFHPMFTHFPIALILTAGFFAWMALLLPGLRLNLVAVYVIYVAALAGLVTVSLGLAAAADASYPSFLLSYLSWHRLLGIATGVLALLSALLGWRYHRQPSPTRLWTFRIVLTITMLVVGITGHLGATLVFGPDHFSAS